MKTSAKKTSKPTVSTEFRPYRVLFLVVVISVATLVTFAALGASQ